MLHRTILALFQKRKPFIAFSLITDHPHRKEIIMPMKPEEEDAEETKETSNEGEDLYESLLNEET